MLKCVFNQIKRTMETATTMLLLLACIVVVGSNLLRPVMKMSYFKRPAQHNFMDYYPLIICARRGDPAPSVRYSLVVRICGSHPHGPGSIPGGGIRVLFPFFG